MATLIFDSLTDHSALDNTNTPILGAAVDLNPQIVSKILDGTTQTDLATDAAFDVRFTQSRVGARFINLDNAAAAVGDAITIEWDPADNAQMTDNSSGVGIAFKMPDSSDNQDVFARLTSICRIDTAGSEDGEFGFNVAWGAHATGGTVVEIATLNINSGAATLTLLTPEPTVVDGNVLGRIDFQAPLETGADALLVAASIWAEADDTFSATLNDTDLVFAVAESETALERMRLSYDGTNVGLTFSGATTISGGAFAISNPITVTDTTAPLILQYDSGEYVTHAVSSAGVYSITTTDDSSDSGAVTIDTVDSITLDSDTATEGVVYADGGTDMLRIFNSSSDVILKPLVNGKDLVIQQDDGNEVARFGNDRKFYLYDEGGEYLVSNGTALTIASGGVAWELPVADGSDGEVLETDGSGNLDWVAQTSGATLTGSTDNTVCTVTGANAFQGEASLIFDGRNLGVPVVQDTKSNWTSISLAGNAWMGAQTTTEAGGEFDLAQNASMSAASVYKYISTDEASYYAQAGGAHNFYTAVSGTGGAEITFGTAKFKIGNDGTLYVPTTAMFFGSHVAHAKAEGPDGMGISIDQEDADDGAIVFKSDDVAHGMTDAFDTNTYCYFGKVSATLGGFNIRTFTESENAFLVNAYYTTGDTGKDGNANAPIELICSKKSGGDHGAAQGANENILCVRGGASFGTKFIVDEDGDILYDGGASAFDSYVDAELVRAFDLATTPAAVIGSKWDEFVRYNEQDLIDAKVLGGPVVGIPRGEQGLVSARQLGKLHNGAIWQAHVERQEMKEELAELRQENIKLASRLNLLEN